VRKLDAYDLKEIKLRRRGDVLNEIPEHYYMKKFLPLTENTFTLLRLVESWKIYEKRYTEELADQVARAMKTRLDESFEASRSDQGREVKLERERETVCFWGYPPILPIRMDLQKLGTKMIYGSSTDISFACLSDIDRDLVFIFNLHVEENIPQEYWFLLKSEEPEIFNRRHMKLGIRLEDLGKKINNNIETARRIREILRDVRNERTPQWKDSAYYIAIFFLFGGGSISMEISNWEALGRTWDNVNTTKHGLPDCIMNYEPLPPMLQMIFGLDRPLFIERLTKILMNNQLYWTHTEKSSYERTKKENYEAYDLLVRYYSYKFGIGIPFPSQSLKTQPPIYDKTLDKWTRMEFEIPKGPRIFYQDLGLSLEEAVSGVLFDITHENEVGKVTRDNIISIGHGVDTKYLRPESGG